jgi:hypothetical protein
LSAGRSAAPGFWEEGLSIFRDRLAREERERLAPLKAEIQSTADPRRQDELRAQVAAVRAEFRKRRQAARYSLFAKT